MRNGADGLAFVAVETRSLRDQPGWLLIPNGPPCPVFYNMRPIQDSGQVVMAIIGIRFGIHGS